MMVGKGAEIRLGRTELVGLAGGENGECKTRETLRGMSRDVLLYLGQVLLQDED